MSFTNQLFSILPEIKAPSQKYLPFKTKLKWTLIILLAYFILGIIPLYGLGANALKNLDLLAVILGAQFGTIISLGIGPLVTASIVLQLLTGSGILKIDTTTHEGRAFFQGLQKLFSIFFVIFEALIYVFLGGLSPALGFSPWVLVIQLILGGLLIMLMDEVCAKWGIGSGISLFIAAGVSLQIFIGAFSPLSEAAAASTSLPLNQKLGFPFTSQPPVGRVWVMIKSLIEGSIASALRAGATIAATIVVFALAVYLQAMKVEIPLSFGKVRGYGIRWPLKFIYTSNIPVILIAALLANIQLMARLFENKGHPWLGTFSGNLPASGIVLWLNGPDILDVLFTGAVNLLPTLAHSLVYMLFMVAGSVVFSIFWVQTSGMDAKTVAKQLMATGLQVSGFRRDERVLETILNRYILPLTVMGAITVGFLAAVADLSGALSRGTGILLTVMIVYKFYEDIAQQHLMEMHPALQKIMGAGK
ncbi:MAG TPA: preprotein translocase subunit SecY [Candidatus Nanoarchaeia archaeon]|nr:preprotein translocase subunit SecY [Candidatus Nanoarchaeia archaeon]